MNTVAECQQIMAAAMRREVPMIQYYEARARIQKLESKPPPAPQPEPEHTTLMPWPEEIAVPAGVERMRKRAEAAGWEVRLGYSRGTRRGVGAGVWVRSHFVGLWAQRGPERVYARWKADVVDEKLKWGWDKDAARVNGRHVEGATEVAKALEVSAS